MTKNLFIRSVDDPDHMIHVRSSAGSLQEDSELVLASRCARTLVLIVKGLWGLIQSG